MMRIKKLVLHQYQHVAPGTTIEFADGVNVLLGKNGTGKTTLLRLLTMIARADFTPIKDEAFDVEFAVIFDAVVVEFRVKSQVDSAQPAGGLPQSSMPGPPTWSLTGKAYVGDSVSSISTSSEGPARDEPDALARSSWRKRIDPFMAAGLIFAVDVLATLGNRPEVAGAFRQWLSNSEHCRFDEALGVFQAIIGASRSEWDAPPLSWQSATPLQSVPPGSAMQWQTLWTPRHSLGPADTQARVPTWSFRTSGALEHLDGILQLNVRPVPRFAAQVELDGHPRYVWQGFDVYFRLDETSEVRHDRLSFGQKRLFAFYWYLACLPEGIILADELVNGFHYDWIAACLDEIGERQAILASQNPLLLDFLEFESAEQVRTSFILCDLQPKPGGGRHWRWRNMSDEAAADVFRAYGVGIQHVSHILRTQGVW